MHTKRILTAAILIPLVLAGIYYANGWAYYLILLLLTLGMGYEWLSLIPLQKISTKIIGISVLVTACLLMHLLFSIYLFTQIISVIMIILWAVILLAVCKYPSSQNIWGKPWIVAGLGFVLLPTFMESMNTLFYEFLRSRGLIIYLLFLVWAADSGAYLVGKLWGRTKLISNVSPGKTMQRAVGGFSLSMLVAIIGFYVLNVRSHWKWFLIAVIVTLISLLGDLLISMLKRRVHLKDTGTIFPGHGGFLDRMDSMIPAATFFYLGLHFLHPWVQ